jgi:hypothetical protein
MTAYSHALDFEGSTFSLAFPSIREEDGGCFGPVLESEYEPETGTLNCDKALTIRWQSGTKENYLQDQDAPAGALDACKLLRTRILVRNLSCV